MMGDGSGVAAGDVDGDGWCDLYFCRVEGGNVLYRNLGNGRFQDITAAAGVACEGQHSTGAVFADVDGNGTLDLLVNARGGGTRLFLNDGHGHFHEASDGGLVRRFGATSMALADVDGNGTLDLYVANYAATKIEDHPNAHFTTRLVNGQLVITAIDGVPTTSPELTNRYFVDASRVVRERGEPDILYLNDGHGHFTPVSWTGGTFTDDRGQPLTEPPYDFGLSVRFRDLNGDGIPDLYVTSDLFPPDLIFLNDGRGHFRAVSNLAIRHTSRFSMGVDFADINRDGHDDLFVLDMLSREHERRIEQTEGVMALTLPVGVIDNRPQYMQNTLFLNRGDGTYAEIAAFSGLEATEWAWMPAFLDVDLDGYEDVLITAGHNRDSLNTDAVRQMRALSRGRHLTDEEFRALKKKYYPVLKLPTLAYRNQGDLTFQDQSHAWGFDYVGMSQGLCLADLDHDGDLDVIVNRLNDVAGIYRNDTVAPRVAVRLKGKPPNTQGISARIKVSGGPVPQSQVVECGGRYLSCDEALRTFAAGPATNLTIEVRWRNGTVSVVPHARPNRIYEIDEQGAQAAPGPSAAPTAAPLFRDVSALLNHTHHQETFNDFEDQPLLARKLSQGGPGVSWVDVDGDARDDLVIGTGLGGHLAVFYNDGHGGFAPVQGAPLDHPEARDQSTVLGWRTTGAETVLLAGSSNYQDAGAAGSCVRQYALARHVVEDTFPGWEATVGPLAMADVDGDGLLDVFVGGRFLPRGYPAAVPSLLFRGTGTKFSLDDNNCVALAQAGLVSGAVFSDLEGNGWPDLVLACQWGPIRVFHNDHGKLLDVTHALGLDRYLGWWNGVATGDFDGDGRLDIVASNWGRNTKYQSHRDHPLQVFYGEWRTPGVVDQLEAYFDDTLQKVVPWATFAVAQAMPWIAERFPTHRAYATASVAELLGDRMATTKVLQANWLETTVFLNRGDHFEAHPLPPEAQFAPAFGVAVGDLNGDGNEDIVLSQNFFAVDGDTVRYDAGRGLVLEGDGRGGFRAVPGQESGVAVYGEQRGCALGDYDGDGREDLVITQNGAQTKLYHNEGAKPGLRVHLAGPPGNPWGIGAELRLQFGSRLGPLREIHAGGGYWSQDSPVQVLGGPEPPTGLWVRWPGGKTMTVAIPSGAREIKVDPSGRLTVTR